MIRVCFKLVAHMAQQGDVAITRAKHEWIPWNESARLIAVLRNYPSLLFGAMREVSAVTVGGER